MSENVLERADRFAQGRVMWEGPGQPLVPLRNRAGEVVATARVDSEDLILAIGRRWHLARGYATASCRRVDGRQTTVLLHRLIMNPGSRLQVDHIDGDRLNNCRSNLRILAPHENGQNQLAHRDSKSGIRGVFFDQHKKRWRAAISRSFDTREEAEAAVTAWRAELMPFSREALHTAEVAD